MTLRVVDVETATGERLAGEDGKEAEELRDRLQKLEKALAKLQEKVDHIKADIAVAS